MPPRYCWRSAALIKSRVGAFGDESGKRPTYLCFVRYRSVADRGWHSLASVRPAAPTGVAAICNSIRRRPTRRTDPDEHCLVLELAPDLRASTTATRTRNAVQKNTCPDLATTRTRQDGSAQSGRDKSYPHLTQRFTRGGSHRHGFDVGCGPERDRVTAPAERTSQKGLVTTDGPIGRGKLKSSSRS